MGERMTEQQQGSETGQQEQQTQQQAGEQSGQQGKQPPWGDSENFNAEKAWEMIQNLRKEKGGGKPDAQLAADLKAAQERETATREALAKAFGVKPEETSDADRMSQRIDAMQEQIRSSERRALAAEHKVPESLLSGTTADEMRASALALVEFAQGAHVAAATAAAQQTPEFQQNPGQGQNGQASAEAQAAAEYEKYYPGSSK